jgi:hypothetical protein
MSNLIIIHYSSSKYPFQYNDIGRFDYQLKLAYPDRLWFQGPSGKDDMIKFIEKVSNYIIITDGHLGFDIPKNIPCIIVHNMCSKEHLTNNINSKLLELYINGESGAFNTRSPDNTIFIECSEYIINSFTKFYPKYMNYLNYLLPNTSELLLDQRKSFNLIPIVLGDWNTNDMLIINKVNTLLNGEFIFKQLNVEHTTNIFLHNELTSREYQKADIYLQLSIQNGNPYSTIDAFCNDLLICGSNLGYLNDIKNNNVALILDNTKLSDPIYIAENLRLIWEQKNEYLHKSYNWFVNNLNQGNWVKNISNIVNTFASKFIKKHFLPKPIKILPTVIMPRQIESRQIELIPKHIELKPKEFVNEHNLHNSIKTILKDHPIVNKELVVLNKPIARTRNLYNKQILIPRATNRMIPGRAQIRTFGQRGYRPSQRVVLNKSYQTSNLAIKNINTVSFRQMIMPANFTVRF